MLTYLRYAMATIWFALSVACLGLWGWTKCYSNHRLVFRHGYEANPPFEVVSELIWANDGGAALIVPEDGFIGRYRGVYVREIDPMAKEHLLPYWRRPGYFHAVQSGPHTEYRFPLWYPALVFAIAGIAVLRLDRRFTLRLAIIATTVVAGLLGMVVAL